MFTLQVGEHNTEAGLIKGIIFLVICPAYRIVTDQISKVEVELAVGWGRRFFNDELRFCAFAEII